MSPTSTSGDHPLRQTVMEIITSLRPQPGTITEHTTLADLGCDSLDRLALAVAIEQTIGVVIADAVLPELRTVADVIDTIARGEAR